MSRTIRTVHNSQILMNEDEMFADENGAIHWNDIGYPVSFLSGFVIGENCESIADAIDTFEKRHYFNGAWHISSSPKKGFRKMINRADRRSFKNKIAHAIYNCLEDELSVKELESPLPYWN